MTHINCDTSDVPPQMLLYYKRTIDIDYVS